MPAAESDPYMAAALDHFFEENATILLLPEFGESLLQAAAQKLMPRMEPFLQELVDHMRKSYKPLTMQRASLYRDRQVAENDRLCEILTEHGQAAEAARLEKEVETIKALPNEITDFDRKKYQQDLEARLYNFGCSPQSRTAIYQTTAAVIRALNSHLCEQLPGLKVADLFNNEEMCEFLEQTCCTAIAHLRQCCQRLAKIASPAHITGDQLEFLTQEYLLSEIQLLKLHAQVHKHLR